MFFSPPRSNPDKLFHPAVKKLFGDTEKNLVLLLANQNNLCYNKILKYKCPEKITMKISELDKSQYDYYVLHYRYITDSHYVVSQNSDKNSFSVKFERQDYKTPVTVENEDTLFQDYWKYPEAYGLEDENGNLVGFLELDFEDWNSRVRITQLLIDESLRRKGYGKMLMDFAKDIAKDRDYRMLILETQSRNTPAIDFYLSQGFVFSGTNLHFYSNDDISEDEVMLELAYFID